MTPTRSLGPLDYDRVEAVTFGDERRHALEDILLVPAKRQIRDLLVGDDHELDEVDGVGSLSEDLALRTPLPAAREEDANVLEVARGHVRGKRLRRLEGAPVAREHVTDFPLWNGDERHGVNAVLQRHQEMYAAAQDVGLKARFAVQRDEPRRDSAAEAPALLDYADSVVADMAHARQEEQHHANDTESFEHLHQINLWHLLNPPSFLTPRNVVLAGGKARGALGTAVAGAEKSNSSELLTSGSMVLEKRCGWVRERSVKAPLESRSRSACLHAAQERHERLRDTRYERRVGLLDHLAHSVEGRVREGGRLSEKELARCKRLQGGSQEALRLGDERRLIAQPGVDATRPEFSLLHEGIEGAIARSRPGVPHAWRRDAEKHVLERTVREVGIGPDGPFPWRRHQLRARPADQEVLANVTRLGDYLALVVDQDRNVDVAPGDARDSRYGRCTAPRQCRTWRPEARAPSGPCERTGCSGIDRASWLPLSAFDIVRQRVLFRAGIDIPHNSPLGARPMCCAQTRCQPIRATDVSSVASTLLASGLNPERAVADPTNVYFIQPGTPANNYTDYGIQFAFQERGCAHGASRFRYGETATDGAAIGTRWRKMPPLCPSFGLRPLASALRNGSEEPIRLRVARTRGEFCF